jgi:adenylosuccinate lyase
MTDKIETSLISVSSIDGRYSSYTSILSDYFSEFALMKERIFVEIEYLIRLIHKLYPINNKLAPFISPKYTTYLKSIYDNFSITDALLIKEIENETNHDIKAIEYFIRKKCLLHDNRMENLVPFIHFGLTSNDINSLSNALILQHCIYNIYIPTLSNTIRSINTLGEPYEKQPFPTYTHGQLATPSTFYKELLVFIDRLDKEFEYINKYRFFAKFGGANGNCNVHKFIYNNIDWMTFFHNFLNEFNIQRQIYTTQIEHYDNIAKLFDHLKRINTIFIDYCQDIWLYISKDLISQKVIKNEVGSSTMPHKVNPILFENAEGNLKMANCLLEFMSSKLPISRLQRDLTDSTIIRNYGTVFGHIIIAFNNILKGNGKITPNINTINNELNNYIILAEPVQYYLKSKGISNSYEILKEYSRGKSYISKDEYIQFIQSINSRISIQLSENDMNNLLELNPFDYTGYY